jgi:hypothetical protein
MTKINFAIKLMLFAFVVLFYTSCEDKTESESTRETEDVELIGTWIDTVPSLPAGYRVIELIFDNDAFFTEKSSSYGIYEGQETDGLSGWFIRMGRYSLNEGKINFLAEKVISWDSFFGGEPDTTFEEIAIFEDCNYIIQNNVLELNYTTYPLDAPENTMRQYKKAE